MLLDLLAHFAQLFEFAKSVELKSTKKFEEAIGFKDMMKDEDPLGSFLRKKTGKEPSGPEKLEDTAEGVVFGPARPPKPPAGKE